MRRFSIQILAALLILTLAACSRSSAPNSADQETNKSLPKASVDPATAATVSGTVTFTGAAPKPQKIDMSMDPSCRAKDALSAPVQVSDGRLANAFVYVKSGLPEAQWDVPATEATIDQDGCRYHPHVLGVMTRQKVRILNSDDTTHNIHPIPQNKRNREWNRSQGPKAEPIVTSFSAGEVMIPIKCNQHPWMKMYLSVLTHPFFAVTADNGKFELKGLPPGTYNVAVVHEKLGEQTQQITVGPKENKAADFSYSSASAQ